MREVLEIIGDSKPGPQAFVIPIVDGRPPAEVVDVEPHA
jgi:hypothetical protein